MTSNLEDRTSDAQQWLDAARPLGLEAAARLMELRLTPLQKHRKADQSLVTNADHEADRIIREGLVKAFPDHGILTEESLHHAQSDSEYLWVVDPLDGTKAYVNGVAGFSVMIGLLRHGQPYAGLVVDPWEGHLYEAVKGYGSYHTLGGKRERVHVSKRSAWPEMPVITSTGFPEKLQSQLQDVLPGPWKVPINSVGIKVGLLVRRQADIYINHHSVHYWDTCAPQIILEEAGGVFTYLDGHPLEYRIDGSFAHGRATLATHGVKHHDVLQRIQPFMQPRK